MLFSPDQSTYNSCMRGRVLGIGALVVIALIISHFTDAGRNDAGEVTKSGDVSAAEVQVGDCFDDLPQVGAEGSTFSSVHAVPCVEGHHWQAFHEEAASLDSFSDDAIESAANSICDAATQTLINNMSSIKYDAFRNAQLTYFAPTYKSWTIHGDRSIQCLIGSDSESYYTSVFE